MQHSPKLGVLPKLLYRSRNANPTVSPLPDTVFFAPPAADSPVGLCGTIISTVTSYCVSKSMPIPTTMALSDRFITVKLLPTANATAATAKINNILKPLFTMTYLYFERLVFSIFVFASVSVVIFVFVFVFAVKTFFCFCVCRFHKQRT